MQDQAYTKEAKKNKKNKNPFAKVMKNGNLHAQKKEKLQKLENQRRLTSQNLDSQLPQINQLLDEGKNPSEELIKSGHLPKNSMEYLDWMTKKVDTNELLEIVQVFQHKQEHQLRGRGQTKHGQSTGTNDYAFIVLKINSAELRQFFGEGKYLMQIWRNKKRLFQHVHDYDIKNIYLNKTELAYVLNMPKTKSEQIETKQFDNNLNFIYVVKPFTQDFKRIKNPFSEESSDYSKTNQLISNKKSQDKITFEKNQYKKSCIGMRFKNQQSGTQMFVSECILFINDIYLMIAEGYNIKYAKIEDLNKKQNKDRGKSKDNSTNQKIKYYDCDQAQSMHYDLIVNKDERLRRQNRGGRDGEKRTNSPGALEKEIAIKNPILEQRQKEMQGNAPLYSRDYDKNFTVETIQFHDQSIRVQWNILAIDQKFTKNASITESNSIIVYAASNNKLSLQLFKINFDKPDQIDPYEESAKMFTDTYSYSSKRPSRDEDEYQIDYDKNNRMVQLLSKEIGNQATDQYISLKLVLISCQNQILTILQTKKGHLDIMDDLLNHSTEADRFTDNDQIKQNKNNISEIVIGAERLHCNIINHDAKKTEQTLQFGINTNTCKVDYLQKKVMPSLMTSILDEGFCKSHIRIFDDMKLQSSLLTLVHGQCVFIYHLYKKKWTFYFNCDQVVKSNLKTKNILEQTKQTNDEDESDSLSDDDVLEEEQKKGLQNQRMNSIIDHCYFNRKIHEIRQVEFTAIKSNNFYQMLINMQCGKLRMLSIIYPVTNGKSNKKPDPDQNELQLFDWGEPSGFELQNEQQQDITQLQPKIICKKMLSKCRGLNKDKKYSTLQMFTQKNSSLYRQMGVYENRIFITLQDQAKYHQNNDQWCPDIYTTNDDNEVHLLLSTDTEYSKNFSLVQVENAHRNHMFMYDSVNKSLIVYDINRDNCSDEENATFWIEKLNEERTITIVQNFDYNKCVKYYLDKENLNYVWKGNLRQQNLITGAKNKYDFGYSILEKQYSLQDGNQIYYKTKNNSIHFVDLSWQMQKKLSYKIFENQSVLYNLIEYDPINDEFCTFISSNVVSIYPNLNRYQHDCEGTFDFKNRFIAQTINHNPYSEVIETPQDRKQNLLRNCEIEKYKSPSEFTSNLCALDAQTNTIKVWNVGTGRLVNEVQEVKHDFQGFKKHLDWDGYTLVIKDRQAQRELLLNQTKEELLTQFRDNFSRGNSKKRRHTPNHPAFIGRVGGLKYGSTFRQMLRDTTEKEDEDVAPEHDIWRRIKINENEVKLEKEFYHNYTPGSKVYLSRTNDVMVEFIDDTTNIYYIRNDGKTSFITKNIKSFDLNIPIYFSNDFEMYIQFDNEKNEDDKIKLKLYETSYNVIGGTKQFNPYKEIEGVYFPHFDQILKNPQGLPYMWLKSKDFLCYININNVEQIIPLTKEFHLKNNKQEIIESYLNPQKLFQRTSLDPLNFNEKFFNTLSTNDLLSIKCRDTMNFNIEMQKIYELQKQQSEEHQCNFPIDDSIRIAEDKNMIGSISSKINMTFYSVNNLRYIKNMSYHSWRIIEMIVHNNEIGVEDIHPSKLKELMEVILPDGTSILNLLIRNFNLQELNKLSKLVRQSKMDNKQEEIPFQMIPDIFGFTALHECIQNNQAKAAEEILILLGKNHLDDHASYCQDILPDLIETSPVAVSKYFADRMIEIPWGLKQTIGDLKKVDRDVDFGVISYPLIYLEQKDIQEKLFVKQWLHQQKERKRLPMQMYVFDLPKLHHFNNRTGKEIVLALSESDDITIFDRKYVQAILEYQWPALRRVIFVELFFPYCFMLVTFNYYSIIQFEQQLKDPDDDFNIILGYGLKTILVVLAFYFLTNEYVQLQNESSSFKYFTSISNYIDVFPMLFVLLAITLSIVASVVEFEQASLAKFYHFVRYSNAFASFFIWFKFLYFLRIFRMYGHLIQTIIQVMYDVKVFMFIMLISLLTFSGTFYILAQNNRGEDQEQEAFASYSDALGRTFELMLGQFDTEKFGSVGQPITYFVFMISAILLIVVMLNLLIAIISDTYATVDMQQKLKMYQEFAELIVENLHLLTEEHKQQADREGNYLYYAEIQVHKNDSGKDPEKQELFGTLPHFQKSQLQTNQQLEQKILKDIQQSPLSSKLDSEQIELIEQMISKQLNAVTQRIENKIDDMNRMQRRVSDPLNILGGNVDISQNMMD